MSVWVRVLEIVECESTWKIIKCYVNLKDHRATSVKGNVKERVVRSAHK